MTPLEKIKAISEYKDDAKISVYIDMVKDEIKDICKLNEYSEELDNVLVEMVIVKLNKAGNEGLSSVNMGGASENYLNEYPHSITSRLNKYTKRVVMR
ncbi:phage head-tail connector protein [Sedimentibacter hydroxybenzoicus DSM 7310]|uniref:Phage head-tail connector protein n=1 Tax=Sedimentibacter hydroxybenzoicus DSM 7310 TaxID=1123245 RepID=A0A974BHQ6_SEDHY|nr:phage head-tail connector protein [Sedimentibacter hydroxybenzoicus]NYB73399.1 phage head-tail connector protein [Sedimentibacter hydroxybenzoicus DSM 7310]